MTIYILTACLVAALLGSFVFALRMNQRARAGRYVRLLQRSAVSMCADIMADQHNSIHVRTLAGRLAILVMSEKTLWALGRNDNLRRHLSKAAADGTNDTAAKGPLGDRERAIVEPVLETFAMAALMYNPRFSKAIKRTVDSTLTEGYAVAAKAHRPSGAPMAAPSSQAEPVKERMVRIEKIVEHELCLA